VTTTLATPADLQAWLAQIEDEERRRAEQRRAETEARCRDNFAAFFREGWHVVEGSRLLWGRHLQAQCETAQAFAEGWLVAHGKATPAMVERQRGYWALHGKEMPPGACGVEVASAPADADEAMPDPYDLLVDHLVVNGGPTTCKSRIWMVFLQAWVWLHDPTAQWACTSGTEKNVIRDSNNAKKLVKSEWYRSTFKIQWRVGADSAKTTIDGVGCWVNSAGGDRISAIWCSDWSGLHADFLFGDDPNDANKVWRAAEREEVRETFDNAMGNRLKFGSVTMMMQQHVHVEDQTNVLKQRGAGDTKEERDRAKRCGAWSIEHRKRWAAFVLPVEYNPDKPSSTPWGWRDWRTARGEVLFAFQWTPAFIASEIERLLPSGWAAQGNQDPENTGGGKVEHGWFGFCLIEGEQPSARPRPKGCAKRHNSDADDTVPVKEAVLVRRKKGTTKLDLDWLEIHVDPKNGSQRRKSSRVGLILVGGKGNQRFILDDRTERHGFLGTMDALREMAIDWAPYGLQKVVVEFKAQGEAVIATLKREIEQGKLVDRDGRPVVVAIEDAEGGSTPFDQRFDAALPTYRAGLVYVLDGASWAEEYIDETCSVPNGAFDDRPDATCQAINRHADKEQGASARFAMLAKLKQAAEQHARRPPGMR
jgi:phage terminase large subunit-like protein